MHSTYIYHAFTTKVQPHIPKSLLLCLFVSSGLNFKPKFISYLDINTKYWKVCSPEFSEVPHQRSDESLLLKEGHGLNSHARKPRSNIYAGLPNLKYSWIRSPEFGTVRKRLFLYGPFNPTILRKKKMIPQN